MKSYKITVNGTCYEVEVEELASEPVQPVIKKVSQPRPPTPTVSPEPKVSQIASSEQGQKVTAPLPGKVIAIHKQVGDQVSSGDVILILEAMKMENEITAPVNGVIQRIFIDEGQAVGVNGDLFTIA